MKLIMTMYRMTQSHHMTSQTTTSADPGDALDLRTLGGAEKKEKFDLVFQPNTYQK